MTAWYEWKLVSRGTSKAPHTVGIRVDKVVLDEPPAVEKETRQGPRDVPHHPLKQSCPRELHFSLEYMQGFADWKTTGAEYVGLSFEGDRPAFQFELPDGGVDIQEHPVYWHLPGGVQCMSLLEFNDMGEIDFKLAAKDEPYIVIGQQMGWNVLGICEDEASLAQYHIDQILTFTSPSSRHFSFAGKHHAPQAVSNRTVH